MLSAKKARKLAGLDKVSGRAQRVVDSVEDTIRQCINDLGHRKTLIELGSAEFKDEFGFEMDSDYALEAFAHIRGRGYKVEKYSIGGFYATSISWAVL